MINFLPIWRSRVSHACYLIDVDHVRPIVVILHLRVSYNIVYRVVGLRYSRNLTRTLKLQNITLNNGKITERMIDSDQNRFLNNLFLKSLYLYGLLYPIPLFCANYNNFVIIIRNSYHYRLSSKSFTF